MPRNEKLFTKNMENNPRRREFLSLAVGSAVAAGGIISSHSPKSLMSEAGAVYKEELKTPVAGRYQVIIAGGGPSGLIAALASARTGAKTLLIEKFPFLGGNGTAGLMTCYNGFRNQKPPEALQTVKGIPAEYIAELVRLGGVADADPYPKKSYDPAGGELPYCIGFDPEIAKIAALNQSILCRQQPAWV